MRKKQRQFLFVVLVCTLIGCMTANGVIAKQPVQKSQTQSKQKFDVVSIAIPEREYHLIILEIANEIYDQQFQSRVHALATNVAYGIKFKGVPKVKGNIIEQDIEYKKNVQNQTQKAIGSAIRFVGERVSNVVDLLDIMGYVQVARWVVHRTKDVPVLNLAYKSRGMIKPLTAIGKWAWGVVPGPIRTLYEKNKLLFWIAVGVGYFLLSFAGEKMQQFGTSVGTKASDQPTRVLVRLCKIRCT